MAYPFTDKEKEIIRKHYYDKGAIGTSLLLNNRSRDTVKQWAHHNGLKVSKEYRTKIAIAANKSWERSEETKRRIGIGHRKYEQFRCQRCGKKISHHKKLCWNCYASSVAGEGNNNWKGGISSLRSLVDALLWPLWIYPIMARDHFTCQNCGDARGHNLNVHHLRSYVSIRKLVLKQHHQLDLNLWDGKKKLAELIVAEHTFDDGITLCKKCHISVHSKKSGELRETPEKDNPQPSPPKLKLIVGGKVQRLIGEDSATNKPDTSARHSASAS